MFNRQCVTVMDILNGVKLLDIGNHQQRKGQYSQRAGGLEGQEDGGAWCLNSARVTSME